MLFPNKLANTIDRVFKTEHEFKKYSTYYTKTNSSSQNESTERTYTSSIHKSRKKQNFEEQNQTICLFKHNRVLQDQKRKTKEKKEINPFTVQVAEPKVIRRFSHDINNLINSHKVPSKKVEKEINNVSLYRDCIKMIDNATQMKSYAKDIINYISSSTLASSTMYNVRKKIKPTSNNNYFDIIVNNVIRKVSFYNSTNEELTIENVMNLLLAEGNILKNETDLYMNKYCYIKNFSTYIDINNKGKDIQYLPLINSTRPLTKNEYINIEKEINNSNNEQKESNFPIDYTLRAKLGRIDQRVGYQNNKKRKVRRIKKYRPNGEVYYEEELFTDSEDNNERKLNSNDFIGGGGAQGGIWDTYNKMHNRKTKNIRNSNISDSSIAEGSKKHLVLTSNLKNENKSKKGKNDANKSMDVGSNEEDDKKNNNEMCTPMLKFVPRNKKVNNNSNNFATLSTKEDSQINSYSRRRRKEETKKDVKGDLLTILRKTKIKDDKEDDKEIDEDSNTINNTKSKKHKKIKIKLDKKKKDEKEKNSSIYNDISSIKGEEHRKDNGNKDIKREDTITISNYSGIDNKDDEDDEDDITQYNNKEKSNKGTDLNGKKSKKGKHKKEKSEKVNNKSRKDDDDDDEKNNSNNNNNNTSEAINSNNENNENNCNDSIKTEENKASNQSEQVNSDNKNTESNNNNDINSSEGGHQKNKSSSIQQSIEESKSPKKKKAKSKSKGKKKKNKENAKNPSQSNTENKEDSKNPQSIIVEKKDTNSNLQHHSKQSSNLRQSNQQSKNQSRHVKLSPSVVSNNININGITDNKSQDNQQQGNVFFDDESPVNTSQHILLKAIDQSPRRTPFTFKKQITRFNSIKSKFYKAEEENDKLLIEGQKKVLEAKKKEFLNRLDKVVQPPNKPDDFSHLSNATKIKDIHIIEKIKYEMFNETTEEGKERYLEMLHQINALKKSDVNSYISELEREFEPFQEEIDAIVKSRKIEERLNKFMQHFSEYRMKEINKRNILGDSIRVVDSKFTTSMSDKLYSI